VMLSLPMQRVEKIIQNLLFIDDRILAVRQFHCR
jgi:hypothetical protein